MALENDLKMVMPHLGKRNGLRMGVSWVVGSFCTKENFWHLSDFHTKFMASSLRDNQLYPVHIATITSVRPLMSELHTPHGPLQGFFSPTSVVM